MSLGYNLQHPILITKIFDHEIKFQRKLRFGTDDSTMKLSINDVILTTFSEPKINIIYTTKRIEKSLPVKIYYSQYYPEFYLFGDSKIFISSKRYRPVFRFHDKINNCGQLINYYPYKSDLCYYEFATDASSKEFKSECSNQKCINLCDNWRYGYFYPDTNRQKMRAKIVGCGEFVEQQVIRKIICYEF